MDVYNNLNDSACMVTSITVVLFKDVDLDHLTEH